MHPPIFVRELGAAEADQARVGTGIANVGEQIFHGDVNIGVPPAQLEALVRDRTKSLQDLADTQKTLIVTLQEKLDLNVRQVRAALEAAGEADVPPERIGATLVEIAGHYKTLREEVRPAPGDDRRIAELKALTREAIDRGDLARADELLAELAEVQEAALERAALDVAATYARRGEVALARLRYGEAAEHFETAADRVPASAPLVRAGYLNRFAEAAYNAGNYLAAGEALEKTLKLRQEALDPDHPALAESLNDLAVLYRATGRYGAAEPLFQRALVIFEKALPADHPHLIMGLENYAGLLEALGRGDEAAELRARAETIRRRRG